MKMTCCPKTWKQVHYTREEAQSHLRSLRQKRSDYNGEVYHCSACGGFHVGRARPGAKPAKQHH